MLSGGIPLTSKTRKNEGINDINCNKFCQKKPDEEYAMKFEHLKELAMSDNGFIFDPTTGYSYSTNELGFIIIKFLQQGLTKAEIIRKLFEEYDVKEDNLTHDYEHYLMQLEVLNLIEED